MSLKVKISIAIAILLWASAFVGIRAALTDYSPEGLALLRYLIASICMGIVYFLRPVRNQVKLTDLVRLLLIGAVGIGIYNITLNYGEIAISSGMASFIISQSPIITTLLSILFLGEELNLLKIIGFLISIIGVALITLGEVRGWQWDISITFILIATLASAGYSLLQKPFLKKYNAIESTTYVIWGGTLFLSFWIGHLQRDILHASLHATLVVAYLGIFPAALGYIMWSYALAEIPASRAMTFLYFTPFVATLLGWLILNEVPTLLSLFGCLLAILGVWSVNHSYKTSTLKLSNT